MKKARIINPGPAALMVVNPKRRKPMATRKRRRTSAAHSTARRTANFSTTKRRTKRRNPSTTHASTRSRRRSVSRRRNPSTGGLISQAFGLAAGITVVGLAQGFVPPIGGVSPIATAGRQAGTGYLLGWAMKKTSFGAKYASDVQLAGVALAAGTLINAYVVPIFSSFLRPAPKAQPQSSAGVGDLVTLPAGNYDPYYGSTPRIANAPIRQSNQAETLKDLLAMPAMPGAYQRFGR